MVDFQYTFFSTGLCVCTDGFAGADCSIDINAAPVVNDDSIEFTCNGPCVNIMISGNNFVQGFGLTCHFTRIEVCWIIWDGFLIRRSSAIRRFFAGFLRCDSRTIMESFLKKIARKFSGNLHKNRKKFA